MAEAAWHDRAVGARRQHRRARLADQPSGTVDLERRQRVERGVAGVLDEVDQHAVRVGHPQPGVGKSGGRGDDRAARADYIVRHSGERIDA